MDQLRRFEACYDLAKEYRKVNADSAIKYGKWAFDLSLQLSQYESQAKSSRRVGLIFKDVSQYDSALVWYQKSLKIREEKKLGDASLAVIYNDLGTVRRLKSQYGLAFEAYLKSLEFRERLGDKQKVAALFNNIAIAFKDWAHLKRESRAQDSVRLGEEKLALSYYIKSLKLRQESGDTLKEALVCYNIAPIYMIWELYDSARYYSDISYKLFEQQGDSIWTARALSHQAIILFKEKKYEEAVRLFEEVLEFQSQHPNANDLLATYTNLGELLVEKGGFEEGEPYLLKALHIIDSLKFRNKAVLDVYENLSKVYESRRDYKNANQYISSFHHLKDSLIYLQVTSDKVTQQKLSEEIRKERHQKEALRVRLKFLSVIAFLSILLVSILLWGYFTFKKQKVRHAFQQKETLEKFKDTERNLLRSQIDNQERILKKIGRELHDKLANDLVASYSFLETIKGKLKAGTLPDPEQIRLITERVKESYEYTKDLSHHLDGMGFEDGDLEKYIKKLAQILVNQQIEVNLIIFGMKGIDLPRETINAIVRITHEAITNIYKYAEAKEVDIQLLYGNGKICLEISDDGKGFDVQSVTNGLGLDSMLARAEKIDGEFKIDTSPGNGTSLFVTFSI